MFTLITGLPGAGKTLSTLELVEKECQGREVYYSGISNLQLPWIEIEPEEFNNWPDYPDGSVFVIDELQRIWPGIPNTQDSPPAVMKLDTHRHRGFDFYCITQSPTLVDHRARKFAGRHLHFERAMGLNMTRRVEFQKVANNPDDYHTRQQAVITTKRLNKKYFDKYESASMHTVKRRVPFKVWMYAALPVFLLIFVINFALDLGNRDQPDTADQPSNIDAIMYQQYPSTSQPDHVETPEQYAARFTPRIEGVPYSAPAYDEVAVVKTYPRPQCVHRIQLRTCKCYTQQATPLDIGFNQCMQYVENGWFNPFIDEEEQRERARERAEAAAALDTTIPEEPHHRVIYIGSDSRSTLTNRRF